MGKVKATQVRANNVVLLLDILMRTSGEINVLNTQIISLTREAKECITLVMNQANEVELLRKSRCESMSNIKFKAIAVQEGIKRARQAHLEAFILTRVSQRIELTIRKANLETKLEMIKSQFSEVEEPHETDQIEVVHI